MWFNWITDFGLPGPDRAQGGRYLLVGPGYDGPLPDSGFHVFHARTTRVTALGRGFMVDNDPSVPVEAIRNGFRISPYVPGGQGTAVATFLAGRAPLGAASPVPETRFVEGSGTSFNTIPPNDFSYWETVNSAVQREPAGAGEPELMGLLAAVGIVKGKPFTPDARLRKILQDAVVVGNATARTISFAPRPEEGFAYYPDSQWFNMLWVGGYEFLDPPPADHRRRRRPQPERRCPQAQRPHRVLLPQHRHRPRDVHAPHRHRLQYVMAMRGGDGEFLDGSRNYRITLPPDIPQSRFWSVMLYDRQTRSMLQTDQPKPDVGSQSGRVKANPDGSTDIYLGPTAPRRQDRQLAPNRPWEGLLRDPAALQPRGLVLRQDLATQRNRTDLEAHDDLGAC